MSAYHTKHNKAGLPYYRSKFHKSKPDKGIINKRISMWCLRLLALSGLCYISLAFFSPHLVSDTSANDDFPELSIATNYDPTEPIPPSSTTTKIPKIIHFVYGLKGPDPSLDLIHYLAIKSAHDVHQPDKIMFHYHYLPTGDLFERAKPFLELHQVDLVPTIYDRRLSHFAHQADVIRLDVLRRYGGIYLDLDVISVKPMDDLLNHEFVMGQEGVGGSVGLCNGVILSQPNARFLQRWQQTYHTFNMEQWNYHSVILPGKLAPYFKDEITIQNHTSFFWPLWDSPGLRAIFLEKSYDWADNYATHLWESAANPHLMKDLSEDVIMTIDNSLNCLLRRFLVDDPSTLDAHRCKIIEHSERADGLVGHWSLERRGDAVMNPMPAYDDSGNDMNGLIRNGYYADNDDGVYVNGQDSYVFLPMPSKTILPLPSSWGRPSGVTVQWDMKTASTHTGRAALVIHSNTCKVFIKTQSILGRGLALRVETWLLAENGWSWHRHKDLSVGAGPFVINQDDRYHRYTLILQNDIKEDLLMPNLVLYMDGEVVASISGWSIPAVLPIHREEDLRIRGLWFGSTEPDHYQDPWDTSLSLEAWYKDISMWERAMDIRDVGARAFHNADPL